MSVYFNQTNITPGDSQFITRQEVIEGFSTLASDLSGVDFNNIFYNPNAKFSTISMPTNGSITNPANIQANSALGVSSVLMTYNRMFAQLTDPFTLGIRDNIGGVQYSPLVAGQLWAKPQTFTNQPACVVAPESLNYITSLSDPNQQKMIIGYNSPQSNVGLFNISSINGQPPNTAGTTFTTLTGSNLTTTGTLTSPRVVSISSINGVAFNTFQKIILTGGGTTSISANVPTTIFQQTLPGNTLNPLTSYQYQLQITIQNIGTVAYPIMFGVRLGGPAGQIIYTQTASITGLAGVPSTGLPIGLSGIAQTGLLTNLVEVIALCSATVSITVGITTSPQNIFTLKLLS